MIVIGESDAFEREYKEKFRLLVSHYGEIVIYENDRATRDIGLHLTYQLESGQERVATSLCWFQLKGLMRSSLSEDQFHDQVEISISLKVSHLQFWYLLPVPTYLVLYVQSVDTFLIINVQKYIAQKWGQGIMSLQQATTTILIPTASVLDDETFNLLLISSQFEDWKKLLDGQDKDIKTCLYDYDLIWHIGTADDRDKELRVVVWDWLSKMRGEIFFEARQKNSEDGWETLRTHMEFLLSISDLPTAYSYLDFFALEYDDHIAFEPDEDFGELVYEFLLSDGDILYGEEEAGERVHFIMGARLNATGEMMFEWVKMLLEYDLIEIKSGQVSSISVAPWHNRSV